MGAWGYGILESDNALDTEANIENAIGVKQVDDRKESDRQRKEALEDVRKLQRAIDYIEDIDVEYNDGEDKSVAYQVLANMILTTGAKVSKETFKQIKKGINQGEYKIWGKLYKKVGKLNNENVPPHLADSEYDWINGRMASINELLEFMKNYDLKGGKVIDVPFVGLFEKIYEGEAKKNKNKHK